MSESRDIRDPIHGFIRLNEQESELVDTRAFQRLRNLRQLALAHLVYPGAMHTRFEHSLGVCHVAGLLAHSLKFTEDEKRLVRLAALMHDLGHGPFSHVSEEALELCADRSKLTAKGEKIHELITAILIRQDEELSRLLSLSDRDKIIALLGRGYGEPIVRSVLSGPLDADKQDYLLRDSYFCGVKYGVFDLPQLHQVLQSVADPAGGKQLMVDPNGIHTLEQFVLAKYYLTTQVIRHRVRLITDQMLLRAICLAIEVDQIEDLAAIYRFDGSLDFIMRYLQWGDSKFLQNFAADSFRGKCSHALLEGLHHRKLLKLVYQTRLNELHVNAREALKEISKPENRPKRQELEKKLAQCIEEGWGLTKYGTLDPSWFVIVHSYTFKSVKEQSRNDESSILINRPTPVFFEDASTLFQSIDEKLSETLVEVYAPVHYSTPTERRNLRNRLRTQITSILDTFFCEGDS